MHLTTPYTWEDKQLQQQPGGAEGPFYHKHGWLLRETHEFQGMPDFAIRTPD